MKKLGLLAVLLLCVLSANAQHPIFSFFDASHHGVVREEIETTEEDAVSGTLVNVFHRSDDVVWSRVIYRVIDVRYKQNYQLYFPTNPEDPKYHSLFRVMLEAIASGMPIFAKSNEELDIKPNFVTNAPMSIEEAIQSYLTMDDGEGGEFDFTSSSNLVRLDNETGKYIFDATQWPVVSKNQLKFLIQEVIFFDKHYSRLYSKILGIAPLRSDRTTDIYNGLSEEDIANTIKAEDVVRQMYQSIMFWIAFDDLRPYLMKQEIIPNENDKRRVTFDEFFAKKLYTSYIIGDNNMFDSMIGQYGKRPMTEAEVRKEQERIATELLNFEQDLWEY